MYVGLGEEIHVFYIECIQLLVVLVAPDLLCDLFMLPPDLGML